MSEDPVTVCESCGGYVERVLFAPAIHFKGSGFHNTDYGTKRRPVGADADGGTKSTDSGSSTSEGGASSATPAPAPSSGKTIGLDKA